MDSQATYYQDDISQTIKGVKKNNDSMDYAFCFNAHDSFSGGRLFRR